MPLHCWYLNLSSRPMSLLLHAMGSNSFPWSVMVTCHNNPKRYCQRPWADWFLNLCCFPFSRPYGAEFLAFSLVIFFLLLSFQAAYYSRRNFHIPDPHLGNAVSPPLEVPCLDTECHPGECLFTRIHPSLADTDARGILHFQWHLPCIRALCFQ